MYTILKFNIVNTQTNYFNKPHQINNQKNILIQY